jgi:hypothetical protein
MCIICEVKFVSWLQEMCSILRYNFLLYKTNNILFVVEITRKFFKTRLSIRYHFSYKQNAVYGVWCLNYNVHKIKKYLKCVWDKCIPIDVQWVNWAPVCQG